MNNGGCSKTPGASPPRETPEEQETPKAEERPEAEEEYSTPEPEERKKTGIVIVSPPDITVYGRGQAFDTTGLLVAWAYSDGTMEFMDAPEYTLTEPDMTRFTPKQIKVSAGGYETGFNIQVLDSDKVLSSVSVNGQYKTVQDFGLPFDKTGLVVTGYYSDGSTGHHDPHRRSRDGGDQRARAAVGDLVRSP
jgi:hypothetical protein